MALEAKDLECAIVQQILTLGTQQMLSLSVSFHDLRMCSHIGTGAVGKKPTVGPPKNTETGETYRDMDAFTYCQRFANAPCTVTHSHT